MVWAAKLIFYSNVRKERRESHGRESIRRIQPDCGDLLIIAVFILTFAFLTKSL